MVSFKAERGISSRDAVEGLDVSVLQDYILGPVLGIQEPRTDSRIEFIGGIKGLSPLMEQADRTGGVAFFSLPHRYFRAYAGSR